MDPIVIYGAEASFAADLVETIRRLDLTIEAAVLTATPRWSLFGIRCVIHENEITPDLTNCPVIVAGVTPGLRKERITAALQHGFKRFPSLADPTAIVPPNTRTGRGNYINAGAVIGAEGILHDHVVINRAAVLGHHTTIEEYGTISPNVALASHCTIAAGAFIGIGATISESLRVGRNAVVGAGSVVIKSVPDNTLAVGNPARIAKEGITGYGDRSV